MHMAKLSRQLQVSLSRRLRFRAMTIAVDCSILLACYFMWSVALDSYDVLQS